MAVYLTKSMLKKLNKVKYPSGKFKSHEEASTSDDHWEKISMDSMSGLNLSKDMICRVCARSGCTPLSYKFNGCDVMGALRSVTNISISVDDSLPKFICTECFESLQLVMNFKQKCETTDKKFRKILNPEGDPLFHSYPYSKHDFQLILHQMKLKRMKMEERMDNERKKREKMVEKKNLKSKEFKCSPCDVTFGTKEELVSHRRERQCMRRACDVCGQLVVSIAHHMRHIHKDKVSHKCPTCGKEFPIITRLKNHMIVHSNTFNFFCDLCPYKSKYKYYLVMHMRTHTGEKPYKCPECPASFVNPSNLNKHKLTHQEKQFKCMLCEKAFRTNAALRDHHDATHMNIKHTCGQCGRDFCYKADLRKHEVRSHNRTKRDYVGGEPAYKQAERLAAEEVMNKWRPDQTEETGGKWRPSQTEETEGKWRPQQTEESGGKWRPVQAEETGGKWRAVQPEETGAKWRPVQPILPAFPDKEFSQTQVQQSHHMYFPDVGPMLQHQPIAQQHTVQITLPELVMKKDEVKMYESQQGMGYF